MRRELVALLRSTGTDLLLPTRTTRGVIILANCFDVSSDGGNDFADDTQKPVSAVQLYPTVFAINPRPVGCGELLVLLAATGGAASTIGGMRRGACKGWAEAKACESLECALESTTSWEMGE